MEYPAAIPLYWVQPAPGVAFSPTGAMHCELVHRGPERRATTAPDRIAAAVWQPEYFVALASFLLSVDVPIGPGVC